MTDQHLYFPEDSQHTDACVGAAGRDEPLGAAPLRHSAEILPAPSEVVADLDYADLPSESSRDSLYGIYVARSIDATFWWRDP